MLLVWRFGMPATLRYMEIRSHWATSVARLAENAVDLKEYVAVVYYSFDLQNHTMRDGRRTMTEVPWANSLAAHRHRRRPQARAIDGHGEHLPTTG